MKKKKMAKEMIYLMEGGSLPEEVAAYFNISVANFEKMIKKDDFLKAKYEIAFTKLLAYYAKRLRTMQSDNYVNSSLVKVFYSHYLKIVESRPIESDGQQDNLAEIFSSIVGKLPD